MYLLKFFVSSYSSASHFLQNQIYIFPRMKLYLIVLLILFTSNQLYTLYLPFFTAHYSKFEFTSTFQSCNDVRSVFLYFVGPNLFLWEHTSRTRKMILSKKGKKGVSRNGFQTNFFKHLKSWNHKIIFLVHNLIYIANWCRTNRSFISFMGSLAQALFLLYFFYELLRLTMKF